MPLKWFTCPDGGRIEITDCLEEGGCRMQQRCAARPFLRLSASDRPWTGKPSTTMLIQGTMLAMLKIQNDYSASPDDRAFMTLGTSAHAKLQTFDDNCCMLEIPLDGGEAGITGIPDVLQIEDGKSVLIDYKTSGSYKVAKALGIKVEYIPTGVLYKSGPRKGISRTRKVMRQEVSEVDRWEWVLQLNWYRMLIEAKSFPVDTMMVQCIVRDGGTHIAHSRGVFRRIYYFPIPRIPDERIMTYFQRKKADLLHALEHGWNDPCTASENWQGIRCQRYCDVAEHCPLGKYLRQEKERKGLNMPIEGLEPRLQPSGTIRLGNKVPTAGGKERPNEVDHFILQPHTPIEEDKIELLAKFAELYGDEPKEIEVMFPVNDKDRNFPYFYMHWGKVLKCKGDGKTATCFHSDFMAGLEEIGKDSSGLPEVRCYGKMGSGEFPEIECPNYTSEKCKMSGTLNVLVAGMGMGIWRINTTSVVSIVNIISGMDLIETFAQRLNLVPFRLQRRKRDGTYDGRKTVHYPLFMEIDGAYENFKKQGTLASGVGELQIPEYVDTPSEGYDEDRAALPESDIPETGELTYMEAVRQIVPRLSETLSIQVAIADVARFTHEQWGDNDTALVELSGALTNDGMYETVARQFNKWFNAYMDKQAEAAQEESGGW